MLKWQVPIQYHQGGAYLMNQNTFALGLMMSDSSGCPIMIAIPTEPGVFRCTGQIVRGRISNGRSSERTGKRQRGEERAHMCLYLLRGELEAKLERRETVNATQPIENISNDVHSIRSAIIRGCTIQTTPQ
jgi:hypothetical protein